jgi:hypothetical protein
MTENDIKLGLEDALEIARENARKKRSEDLSVGDTSKSRGDFWREQRAVGALEEIQKRGLVG